MNVQAPHRRDEDGKYFIDDGVTAGKSDRDRERAFDQS
jgi:hypothetical protein